MEYVILAMIIVVIWYYLKSKKSPRESKQADIELPVKITVSTSSGDSFTPEKVDTGKITETSDNGYILNPKSPFPLTVFGLSREDADILKSYLDEEANWGRKLGEITFLIAQANVRCKEIDDYISKYRPLYIDEIEGLKAISSEWKIASEKDKVDLLLEFKQKALAVLPSKPSNEEVVSTILEDKPSDVTADDELLSLFNQETDLYRFYVSQLWSADKVRTVPADDYYRKKYEALVQKGLARRGQDINLEKILSGLRLKDINEALQELIEKPFGRKAKAIEFALKVPDMKERIGKQIAFREMFQIVEPEGIDVKKIQRCYGHANAIATLLRDTYVSGIHTLRNIKEGRDAAYDYWEIVAEDCCTTCKPNHGKKYKKRPSKLPPFHVGCSCELEGGYN